ncbi:MAG TPA: amino acid adenylation domain-containing protein, partial [Thermoanaerobaculia bacterium]|nr:amino acid adenylation domain-containing protein [Thermoanaerobaculia bacterium]
MTGRSPSGRPGSTLVDLLRLRAEERGEARAYTFLADGEAEEGTLSYAGLDRQARTIGAALARLSAAGERVVLLFPPGLEFIAAFFGCLYAGAVAVPAYPPRSQRGLPRLLSILSDARPRVVLTTRALLGKTRPLLARLAADGVAVDCLATDDLAPEGAEAWTAPDIDGGTLAFLQYTSGSTSTPKGVMVSHANLLHNEEIIRQAFGQSAESVILGWLPLYHDMGLIGNVLQPLYVGAPCILMSPVAFLQKPLRWLEAIGRYRATTSGGPDFAYALCAARIGEEQRAGLDLSSWRVAFNGAEPVRAETMERFAAAFASCGFRREAFYPCYGLAEATLFVTGGTLGDPPRAVPFDAAALEKDRAVPPEPGRAARELVGCGQAWGGQEVLVVDPATSAARPAGTVGEVWVAGPSVAHGYWRNPEATERDFHARLADEPEAGPFLRTGDLGFFQDGELFVTGRLKDLIILRGRNLYPQDVELTAERAHPALRPGCGAAFAVEAGGAERLVVTLEMERRADGASPEAVAEAVRRAVAEEHEAQVHEVVLLRAGTIPKTSSGKIQRHACRAGYLAGGLEVVGRSALDPAAPGETETVLSRESLLALEPGERPAVLEAWLRDRAARLLRTSSARIEPGLPLTAAGLDSLAAVELRQAVEQDLGATVPLTGLLEGATVAEIAAGVLEDLAGGGLAAGAALVPGEPAAEFPLSHGQQALWFLQRLAPGSAAYHITAAVRVAGDLDVPALHRAFQALADRHPALRTTFHAGEGGEPFQRVHERLEVGFVLEDAAGLGEGVLAGRLAAFAHAPFVLETGPLLRAAVFALGEAGHALVLAVHHLVADFTSLSVAFGELARLYELEAAGAPSQLARLDLAPLPVSYGDYVRWQAGRFAGPEGERLWEHWRQALAGPPPDLDLVTDRPRPSVQTDRGASMALALGPDLSLAVRELARSSGATLFTTLLAAFQTLLHRYTGQWDFAVGAPVAGRNAPELADLVGYFVNPVVLRAPLGDEGADSTFAAFLGRVRRVALEAFEHQELPFALLAERLQPSRDPSRSPLFQAMLVLQTARRPGQEALAPFALGESGAEISLGPLALTSLSLPERPAQLDLTMALAEGTGEGRGGLAVSLQFNADLFDPATAGRMLGHFRTLLAAAAAAPERTLGDLPLLAAAERDQLLVEWNATAEEYPRERLLHELFEEQAERTPDRVALESGSLALTYRELESRANRLANHLIRLGITPETPVGVHLERSADVAVSVLALLKSGAEYLPLDPAYPPERVAYTLEDAGAPLVLTLQHLEPSLDKYVKDGGRRLRLDADWREVARERAVRPGLPAGRADPESAAYLIYTSGSTGLPKGVQVRHRGVVNFLSSMARRPGLGAGDVLAAVTTLSFDIAGLELYLPWTVGARVVLVSREDAADGTRLLALLRRTGATAMQATPSTWRLLLAAGWEGDPPITALCGGEALPRDLAEALLARAPSVWNLYGPTETTIWSAVHQVLPEETAPVAPLGRPIANTGIYIVDAALRPAPTGVPGELLIGGDGLARGYFRRPALTAERFVPDGVSGAAGARLYRTGDLARWRAGGTLEFLGRLDHQVKIRGHRVELGEVEAALTSHPAVAQAVVAARQDPTGGQRLVAYLVGPHPPAPSPASPPPSPGEGEVSTAELRRFLAERLPEAFVPSLFVTLPAFPLTPNGKVDRKALPAPELVRREGPREAPRSEVERAVAAVWKEVLGIPEVGLHDNFFDLGGHSLLAAQVHARLLRSLGRDLSLVDLFRYPTVATLARHLSPEEAAPAPAAPVSKREPAAGRD